LPVDRQTWELAAVLAALCSTAFLTGGGWYEQAVLDSVWPRNPSIVRPSEGGASRRRFWVPAHSFAAVTLGCALWGAWREAPARYAVLTAIALYLLITIVTVGYFARAVVKLEKATAVRPNEPSSLTWVRRSRWRMLLAFGLNVAVAVAAANLIR
jgi:hypothetical protein